MKKILLLFFLLLTIIGYGQTYTIKISYEASSVGCHAAGYNWDFSGDGNLIDSFSAGGNSMNISAVRTYPNVPNYKKFKFRSESSCTPLKVEPGCQSDDTLTVPSKKLLTGNYLVFGGCNGGGEVFYFKPNITISNLNTSNPTAICAGEQLTLAGFPAGFPDEAYHWQYSLNNQTWIDIPLNINGKKTNNTPITNVYLQELLGANHVNYLNKQIYFRLGYDQTNNFTNPMTITYSACAPLVNNIIYDPPKCHGENINKVDVVFDTALKSGESLDRIKMKDVSNGIERNERTDITSLGTTPPYVYSFNNLDGLENGHTYRIVYQAQIIDPLDSSKKILKGFLESTTTFTYADPAALSFELSGTNPVCNNDKGLVTITAHGGQGEYYYYSLDGGTTKIQFTNKTSVTSNIVNGVPTEVRTGVQQIELPTNVTAIHNIIITDANNCIEKP